MKVFTVTSGRTGTAYLAECFRYNAPADWQVEHEGPFFGGFGTFRPDISHLHAYNFNTHSDTIRNFWKRKLTHLPKNYVETSHINCKAGLIENLDLLDDRVVVIHLRRNIRDVFFSMAARGSMINKSDMWMWHLDPEYPMNLTAREVFADDMLGNIAWYLLEMETRSQKMYDQCRCEWLEVQLEKIISPSGLALLLEYFDIAHKVTPPNTNANPELEFDYGFLAAAENVIAELEERIRAV